MASGWAAVVIRCERIEGRVNASELEVSDSVLLLRVQVALGGVPAEVYGPRVVQRSDAGQWIGAVLDGVYEALADQSPRNEFD
jgi:hypothetical protein